MQTFKAGDRLVFEGQEVEIKGIEILSGMTLFELIVPFAEQFPVFTWDGTVGATVSGKDCSVLIPYDKIKFYEIEKPEDVEPDFDNVNDDFPLSLEYPNEDMQDACQYGEAYGEY